MYDLLIESARICDGTGAPSFHGCVAVKDGLIAAVGNHRGEAAARTINADGLVLVPDLSTHIPITTRKWPGTHDHLLLLAWHHHRGDG